MSSAQKEILRKFNKDRVLAHQVLFAHRHPNRTPPFISDMILAWHSPAPWLLFEVFRGGAKSTTAEEAIIIKAGYREIHNYLIVGATKDRAYERLHAIRYEIEQNERLAEVFGDLRGPTWGDGELVLSNNVRLLALGKGQSLRGVKYTDARPDGVFGDDLEEPEDVRTPEARERTLSWFLYDLIPALDTNRAHARVAATPLDPEALPIQLVRAGWESRKYPIEYLDKKGVRTATWPDREPMEKILERRNAAVKVGKLRQYNQEYMCETEVQSEKSFKTEMFRSVPHVRTWQAVYCMFDPARTVRQTSATTGFAAWSWIGGKLVVWKSSGKQIMPDEIISDMFQVNEDLHPVFIGAEEDGLNEWMLQPIRQEQVKRGVMLPLKAVKAPPGKMDFIRGSLQPFFNAREVEFAEDMPDLKAQLLSFPTGKIDIPNALAYAIRLRPGAPMYEDFGGRNVVEEMDVARGRPVWLAMGATRNMACGVLLQSIDGQIRIYADWVREGEAAAVFPDILREANMEAGVAPRLLMGPLHFDQYNNVGLRQAASSRMLEVRKGTQPEAGRDLVRGLLRREVRSMPALVAASRARWVCNGFAGGYARVLLKGGMLADHAEEGPYRVILEAIESFVGLANAGVERDDDEANDVRYDFTAGGRKFMSALR